MPRPIGASAPLSSRGGVLARWRFQFLGLTGMPCPGDDRARSTCLLAFPIREFLERFPGQPAHSRLQVRDGDAFGIFHIIQRVQDLFSRVASDVGSSRNLDHESCLWLHISLLCHGHSTLGTDGALVEFATPEPA